MYAMAWIEKLIPYLAWSDRINAPMAIESATMSCLFFFQHE